MGPVDVQNIRSGREKDIRHRRWKAPEGPTTREKVDANEAQSLLHERRTKEVGDPDILRLPETSVPGGIIGPRRVLTTGRSNDDRGMVTCQGMPEGVEDRNALAKWVKGERTILTRPPREA